MMMTTINIKKKNPPKKGKSLPKKSDNNSDIEDDNSDNDIPKKNKRKSIEK